MLRSTDLTFIYLLISVRKKKVVSSQIWSLLPGFCKEPTDLGNCFKDYARTLGEVIKTDPSLRLTVLNALRQLIKTDENKEELAKVKQKRTLVLLLLKLVKFTFCITDEQLISTFFEKAIEKVHSAESGIFVQQASIDLCKAMISSIQKEQLQELYEICKSLLRSSESEVCQDFVKENLEDLRLLFSETVSGLIPASRALRLYCLGHIVSQATEDVKSTILNIIPEAVLCTKENSLKARTAAYELLVTIGHAMIRISSNSKEGIKEYITCLLAGLAGSPHFISASILSIGRVIYEFKDELNSDIINNLINIIGELLKVQSREIVTSALSFFKILFAAMDTDDLAQHVQTMIESLTSIAENHQRAFDLKLKKSSSD
ncbi:RRP12-like protein [Trichonephila clavipes]|nr:RRP12-like protein [Trichonephila clavipes]